MMTQFFQVLKPRYNYERYSGGFMMTQFFQVLKRQYPRPTGHTGFMMTQFFQVLKQNSGDTELAKVL